MMRAGTRNMVFFLLGLKWNWSKILSAFTQFFWTLKLISSRQDKLHFETMVNTENQIAHLRHFESFEVLIPIEIFVQIIMHQNISALVA